MQTFKSYFAAFRAYEKMGYASPSLTIREHLDAGLIAIG